MATDATDLPRPFYDDWPHQLRSHAHALWHWHSALANPQPIGANGTRASVDDFFAAEQRRATAGEPMQLLREEVWQAAYYTCEVRDLNRDLLAEQVAAAQQLQGTVRFDTQGALESFVRSLAVPHARLLAGLAGADNSWQLRHIDELARGFFHVGRLATLPHDLRNGRLFIPIADLRQANVSLDQLRTGDINEGVRRLLWKQSVRGRDALAQGQPLMRELSRRYRYALKRWWLAALEMLNELERRDYDLWTEPLELPFFRRVQVHLQTWFGRATAS